MRQEALVVGASGMLSDVVRWLSQEGYHVTVVGRDIGKLQRLQASSAHPDAFSLLDLDYHETEQLRQRIAKLLTERERIDLVVTWIHTTAPEAMPILIQELSRQESEWRLYHVNGSRAWKKPPQVPTIPNGTYNSIILGFVLEQDGARWLTNQEISQGVIRAIQSEEPLSIIGVVEPWEKRPSY
jgi:NAD(P)-dependent dehydrogenase (short-subunit alcohol dehydrogenase family)